LIKQKLHEQIDSIDNTEGLNLIRVFIETYVKNPKLEFTEYVRDAIRESKEQMKEGRVYSNEDVNKRVEDWLKE
jgi:predicted transcriptional regulator